VSDAIGCLLIYPAVLFSDVVLLKKDACGRPYFFVFGTSSSGYLVDLHNAVKQLILKNINPYIMHFPST